MGIEDELRLCRYLLSKYADVVNEREKRTIGEIKGLVDGKDLTVVSLVEDFKGSVYTFEHDYLKALKQVFEFVRKEISFVDAEFNINYWLAPREILEVKAADDEDLAVFLCASMKALGDATAEVIIAEMDNLKTHAFVLTEYKGEAILLDPSIGHGFEDFRGTKADVLKKYSFGEQKIRRFLYRFNSEKYEQFLDENSE